MLSTIDFAVINYDANWVISLIVAVLIIALGDFIIFKYVSRHPAFIPGLIVFEVAALLAFILPIIGLIMGGIFRKHNYMRNRKACRKGALVGLIFPR